MSFSTAHRPPVADSSNQSLTLKVRFGALFTCYFEKQFLKLHTDTKEERKKEERKERKESFLRKKRKHAKIRQTAQTDSAVS